MNLPLPTGQPFEERVVRRPKLGPKENVEPENLKKRLFDEAEVTKEELRKKTLWPAEELYRILARSTNLKYYCRELEETDQLKAFGFSYDGTTVRLLKNSEAKQVNLDEFLSKMSRALKGEDASKSSSECDRIVNSTYFHLGGV
jgi:hypothetical protein